MGDPKVQSQERAAFPSKINGDHKATNDDTNGHSKLNIIDIRSDKEEASLLEVLKTSLRDETAEKSLPDLLLWDAQGLKLFEKITYLDSYYLTNQEIQLLEQECDSIAKTIAPGTMLIELGSGNLRKIKILLSALDRAEISVDYFALDLDKSELERTLSMVPSDMFKHVTVNGLWGSYDDGQRWMQEDNEARRKPKCVLSLGSTIGSFARADAADFLGRFAKSVSKGGRSGAVLLAVDGCKDGGVVWRAYNDDEGINAEFIKNSLKHANRVLRYEAFRADEWTIKGEWNQKNGSHDWYYIPLKDVAIEGGNFKKDEKVKAVHSAKYDIHDRQRLYEKAGVEEVHAWILHGKEYGIYQVRAI